MPARSTGVATGRRQAGIGRRATGSAKAVKVKTVEQATLDFLKTVPATVAASPEAAAAVAMAKSIDMAESHHARSQCALQFKDLMARLRELAPPMEEADGIDQLAQKRAARLATAQAS